MCEQSREREKMKWNFKLFQRSLDDFDTHLHIIIIVNVTHKAKRGAGKVKKKFLFVLETRSLSPCFDGKYVQKKEKKSFVCASKREHEFFCHLIFSIVFTSSSSLARFSSFCHRLLFFYEFIFLFDCHLGVQLKIVPIHKGSVRALTFSLSYHYCLNIQRFLSSRVCQRVKGMGENCLIVVESKRKSLPSSCSHSIKHNHFPYEYANNLILWQKISSVKQFSEETSKGILFV